MLADIGVMDEENGLYYMRARYYDPEVGRFTAKDPLLFAGGDIYLYGYVLNNPVNWVDASGLFSLQGALRNPRVTALYRLAPLD